MMVAFFQNDSSKEIHQNLTSVATRSEPFFTLEVMNPFPKLSYAKQNINESNIAQYLKLVKGVTLFRFASVCEQKQGG